jgi:hypothetical protein
MIGEEKNMGLQSAGTTRKNNGQQPVFKRFLRGLMWGLLMLLAMYVVEYFWGGIHKGQTKSDYAWESIAHETLSRQYSGMPQMRIAGGGQSPTVCNFWSFEGFWGHCVSLGLNVRDYRAEDMPIVEREVKRLVDQMREPCRLLPTLALPDAENLAREVGCGGWRKKFKLRIRVNSVTVANERGPLDRPRRWTTKSTNHLYTTDFVEGQF